MTDLEAMEREATPGPTTEAGRRAVAGINSGALALWRGDPAIEELIVAIEREARNLMPELLAVVRAAEKESMARHGGEPSPRNCSGPICRALAALHEKEASRDD